MPKNSVLSDHIKRGKTLVPPFIHQLGPLEDISWVKTVLPELLWIALIQDNCGIHRGVELITTMARSARKVAQLEELSIFGSTSEYGSMDASCQKNLQHNLAQSGYLAEIQASLRPIVMLYPNFPLSFLFTTSGESHQDDLDLMKHIVRVLYDRAHRDTVFVQATFIWLAFDSGKLKVAENLVLARFPEIEHYPNTDLSHKIAGSIRASVNGLFGIEHRKLTSHWSTYFWNRGLEIDNCYFGVEPR